MFLKSPITTSTGDYFKQIERLENEMKTAVSAASCDSQYPML